MFADIEKPLKLIDDPKTGEAPDYILAVDLCCYTEHRES
jgi:hypothetical protein